jgi:hypothetical protein
MMHWDLLIRGATLTIGSAELSIEAVLALVPVAAGAAGLA